MKNFIIHLNVVDKNQQPLPCDQVWTYFSKNLAPRLRVFCHALGVNPVLRYQDKVLEFEDNEKKGEETAVTPVCQDPDNLNYISLAVQANEMIEKAITGVFSDKIEHHLLSLVNDLSCTEKLIDNGELGLLLAKLEDTLKWLPEEYWLSLKPHLMPLIKDWDNSDALIEQLKARTPLSLSKDLNDLGNSIHLSNLFWKKMEFPNTAEKLTAIALVIQWAEKALAKDPQLMVTLMEIISLESSTIQGKISEKVLSAYLYHWQDSPFEEVYSLFEKPDTTADPIQIPPHHSPVRMVTRSSPGATIQLGFGPCWIERYSRYKVKTCCTKNQYGEIVFGELPGLLGKSYNKTCSADGKTVFYDNRDEFGDGNKDEHGDDVEEQIVILQKGYAEIRHSRPNFGAQPQLAGNRLLIVEQDPDRATVYQIQQDAELQQIWQEQQAVRGRWRVCLSPDGNLVAYLDKNNKIYVRVFKQEIFYSLPCPIAAQDIDALYFTQSSQHLVLFSSTKKLYVWEIESEKLLYTEHVPDEFEPHVSFDAKILALVEEIGQKIIVKSLENGTCIYEGKLIGIAKLNGKAYWDSKGIFVTQINWQSSYDDNPVFFHWDFS